MSHANDNERGLTAGEIAKEVAGSICFLALLYFIIMALYVFAPYQPGPYSETVMAGEQ